MAAKANPQKDFAAPLPFRAAERAKVSKRMTYDDKLPGYSTVMILHHTEFDGKGFKTVTPKKTFGHFVPFIEKPAPAAGLPIPPASPKFSSRTG
jgi:hypothetical protein